MSTLRLWLVIAMMAAGGGAAPAASAADDVDDHSAHILYHGGPVRKLGRGVANVFTGWTEVLLGMQRTAANEGQMAGASLGLLRGTGRMVGRTLAGAFETVTFLLPNPGQRGYAPLVEPEYLDLGNLT